MEFSRELYQQAYIQTFDGISEAIKLLESERIITKTNLEAVILLKEIQKDCEEIFVRGK